MFRKALAALGLFAALLAAAPAPAQIVVGPRSVALFSPARGPVTGDAIAFTVRDSTKINNVDGNGFLADLTLKGLGAGLAYSLSPNSSPRAVVTVQRPGYDTSGVATTVTDSVILDSQVYQPSPNNTSTIENLSGADVKLTLAQSEYIYAGDTLTSVAMTAGAYGTSTTKILTSGLTNASTLAYPPVIGDWADVPKQILGAGRPVEVYAYHRFARNSQPIPYDEITCTPTTGSPVTKVAAYGKSTLYADNLPVYAATFADSDFPSNGNADVTCSNIAKPWVGDSTAIRTTVGTTFPSTTDPVSIVYRTVGPTPNYVYIDNVSGVDASCVANATAATAAASPCLTINQGFNKLFSVSLDASGFFMRLKETATAYDWTTTTPSPAGARTAINTWLTVEGDPASSDPKNLISIQTTGTGNGKDVFNNSTGIARLKFQNVGLTITAGNSGFFYAFSRGSLWLHNVKLVSNMTASTAWMTQVPYLYVTQTSATAASASALLFAQSGANVRPNLIRAVTTNKAVTANVILSTTIDGTGCSSTCIKMGDATQLRAYDLLLANTRVNGWNASTNMIGFVSSGSPASVKDVAIVNSLFECGSNTSSVLASPGDHDNPPLYYNNLIFDYVTATPTQAAGSYLPCRLNMHAVPATALYPTLSNSVVPTWVNSKMARSILPQWAAKGDVFSAGDTPANTGAQYVVGGYSVRYGVGGWSRVSEIDTSNPSFNPNFEGLNSFRAQTVTFNSWGTADYRPTPAGYPVIPAGAVNQGLKYDLGGTLRDTTAGAAGAYEHP